VLRPNGEGSNILSEGAAVTPVLLEAFEDLEHTLTTGERRVPEVFYDLCASAFGTTRADAKQRLLAVADSKLEKASA
jgi:hypothetical protein